MYRPRYVGPPHHPDACCYLSMNCAPKDSEGGTKIKEFQKERLLAFMKARIRRHSLREGMERSGKGFEESQETFERCNCELEGNFY